MSTRSVDDLVVALGADSGISKSEVSARTARERALVSAAQEQHRCAIEIRQNRDLSGLSTDQLAQKVDLTLTTVRGYLNGTRHASLTVLVVLADAAQADLTTNVSRRP